MPPFIQPPGGGGGATSFSELSDVQVEGTLDGSAPRFDQIQQVWIAGPGSDAAARTFRGAWEDPAAALLWSTDFSDPAEASAWTISHSVGLTSSGGALAPISRVSITDSIGAGPPSFPYALLMRNTSNWDSITTVRGTRNLGAVADLAGKFVSRIAVWASHTKRATNTANIYGAFRVNGLAVGTINTTAGTTVNASPWADLSFAVGGTNPTFMIENVDQGGNSSAEGFSFYLAGMRVYGAADAADLYGVGDVVAHEGSFWRSLFAGNTEEPSGASSKWEAIPPLAP